MITSTSFFISRNFIKAKPSPDPTLTAMFLDIAPSVDEGFAALFVGSKALMGYEKSLLYILFSSSREVERDQDS